MCGCTVEGYSSVMQWLVDEALNGGRGMEIYRFFLTVCRQQRYTVPYSVRSC